ncbi:DUF805 domain-containing protein [Staphylococcus devriesei]|uniref:DUF805 domain-containing protein n=1 Tax=Staphylococcus devriesei TaxID=586733 RepID=A0A2K4DQN4_9STAP|nr:DUF805 domain-containing protein [Staphylococcus devriesei]MCE5090652.1 DUF805 domain-containing protein [Staphylococcus devriesei]MCE5096780.1 DUF805 domain-containing protein [Staphylococcus devriesei]PNZ89123.1 DUF805 domain-containing protein [Staphylococcus devriesei]PTE73290.1 DUF805 domain-containing protein [Staphylococcus devriesei]PTF05177.1 DUF805 domain-containing protein [Staphylococcus devriesei]
MIEAYKLFWQNYLNIEGRTRRRHYWLATLCNILVLILLGLIFGILTSIFKDGEIFFGIVYEIIDLVLLIGLFTMSVRRFHDVGHTMTIPVIMLVCMLIREIETLADTYFHVSLDSFFTGVVGTIVTIVIGAISFALLIISIIALIYCIKDSEQGSNTYGPNPKEPEYY